MKLRLLALCLAAFCVAQKPHFASAARHGDPLEFTDSFCRYSKKTGQAVLYVSLILPHADTIAGTAITVEIGSLSQTFIYNGKGVAQTGKDKSTLRLGTPTCRCSDASHTAKLTVKIKGSNAKQKTPLIADGGLPTEAKIRIDYLSETLEHIAPLTVTR